MKNDENQLNLLGIGESAKLETGETAKERKIVQNSALISLQGPNPDDMAFYHSVLCQVGMPRSKVEAREFTRTSGRAWLILQAGSLDEGTGQPVEQPLPYGALPRLILAYMSTYAIRNKTRVIPMGDTAAEFMRDKLGMETTGRRYKALRAQMHALAACRLQLGLNGRTFNGQPIQQFDAWAENNGPQRSIWPGVAHLGEEFYNSVIRSAVPLDNRALMSLKGTALGLDAYVWFAQRLHCLDRTLPLSWAALKDQFGQEYEGPNGLANFRDEFTLKLRLVKAVYPQANVTVVRGGIEMKPSPPPIPPRSLK